MYGSGNLQYTSISKIVVASLPGTRDSNEGRGGKVVILRPVAVNDMADEVADSSQEASVDSVAEDLAVDIVVALELVAEERPTRQVQAGKNAGVQQIVVTWQCFAVQVENLPVSRISIFHGSLQRHDQGMSFEKHTFTRVSDKDLHVLWDNAHNHPPIVHAERYHQEFQPSAVFVFHGSPQIPDGTQMVVVVQKLHELEASNVSVLELVEVESLAERRHHLALD